MLCAFPSMNARRLATLLILLCAATGVARAAPGCEVAGVERARLLAREASDRGEFHLAATCYRIAGEPLEADRALARHFARTSSASGQRMSETIASAKQQAREIRDSLRRR
jgi:hypothetical protein